MGFTGPLFGPEFIGLKWPQKRASFAVNPNFPALAGSAQHQIDVLRCGASTWRDQSAADFRFEYSGTTIIKRTISDDGVNAVFFTPEDGNGALAVTAVFGLVSGRFTSFDMVFFGQTDGFAIRWSGVGEPLFGQYDLRGTATHEFGHALGLAHSPVAGATMVEFEVDRGLPFRTLHQDDIDGVEAIYGTRTGANPFPRIASIAPREAPAGGEVEVLITGSNFTWESDTQLDFGAVEVPISRLVVETCSVLRVTSVPAHDAGSADVTVTNSLGSFTLTDGFLFLDAEPQFRRGDVNSDGAFDISDPVTLLLYLFLGRQPPACLDAADANDDGSVQVTDAVYLLLFLFQSGEAPRAPFPGPGTDPSLDSISCL
ncbi:MAG: matrixin family metalloprotease [Planctomycetes bacterium]|nr:matrixin family metalloprotease [Planctomycetota bacterium]